MSLSQEEKQELAKRISRGVQVVCSSVAQLHLTSPDPNASPQSDETGIIRSLRENGANQWKFTNIEGALLLTVDSQNICHFRIYDLDEYRLRFQYEIYENLDYQRLGEQCHAFEMESCVCGFNFSSPAVANKFFDRVQGRIPRVTRAPAAQQVFSPFVTGAPPVPKGAPPVPQRIRRDNSKPNVGSISGNLGRSKRTTRNQKPAKSANVFLGNGMLDPNNVPPEWKKILKTAGIRKRDLRNPEMFNMIQDVLAQHDIALNPPDELDYDDERLKQYYTNEQLAQWKQYQMEMKKYEEDQRRYEEELKAYKQQQQQEEKLKKLLAREDAQMAQMSQMGGGMTGAQRLRQSVMQFQGKEIKDALPQIPRRNQQAKQLPRMSVARPALPALPVIPQSQQKPKNARKSRVVMMPSFLQEIKKEDYHLKRVSVLPTIKNMGEVKADGILETLRMKMVEMRNQVTGDESDGDDDDFSDFVDE